VEGGKIRGRKGEGRSGEGEGATKRGGIPESKSFGQKGLQIDFGHAGGKTGGDRSRVEREIHCPSSEPRLDESHPLKSREQMNRGTIIGRRNFMRVNNRGKGVQEIGKNVTPFEVGGIRLTVISKHNRRGSQRKEGKGG